VWSNHVVVVVGQEHCRATFAGVDVEVVEPEIDEHLLQLPLAVHRAQQFLGCERDDLLARELAQLLLIGAVRRRAELRQHRFGCAVVNARGMQLLVEPSLHPHHANAFGVARPRAEGESIQNVGEGGVVGGARIRDPGAGGSQLSRRGSRHGCRHKKCCKTIHG
jgi:hypothetical protein